MALAYVSLSGVILLLLAFTFYKIFEYKRVERERYLIVTALIAGGVWLLILPLVIKLIIFLKEGN